MISSLTAFVCVVAGFIIGALVFSSSSEEGDEKILIDWDVHYRISKEIDEIILSDISENDKNVIIDYKCKELQEKSLITQGEMRARNNRNKGEAIRC